MSDNHQHFLQRAIELSLQGSVHGHGGPFGAVIVKDGEIIGEGFNRVTSSNDPTAHAEIVAIRDACKKIGSFQLTGCIIYTSCEPCPMCLGAIYWARPEKIFFANTKIDAAAAGFDDAFIYEQLPLQPAERVIPMIHLPSEEAIRIFKKWIMNPDKIVY